MVDPENINDSTEFLVSDLLKDCKDFIRYDYDFGDGWEHKVTLLKIHDTASEKIKPFKCLSGKRACPIEDCGGIYGHERIVEMLSKKKLSREMREFVPEDYDPEDFDIDMTNELLEEMVQR